LLASTVCIAVGVVLIAWSSGLALLAAFLFAGLAEVTDRPAARAPASSGLKHPDVGLADDARYELDSAA
jgi:hypothetical protein